MSNSLSHISLMSDRLSLISLMCDRKYLCDKSYCVAVAQACPGYNLVQFDVLSIYDTV